MFLTDAALGALNEKCFIKRRGHHIKYLVIPNISYEHLVSAKVGLPPIDDLQLASFFCEVRGKMLFPVQLSFQDSVAADWELYYELNNIQTSEKTHAGILIISPPYIDEILRIIDSTPVIEYITHHLDNCTGMYKVYCQSSQFKSVRSGEPTPHYSATVNGASGEVIFQPL